MLTTVKTTGSGCTVRLRDLLKPPVYLLGVGGVLDMDMVARKFLIYKSLRERISTSGTPPSGFSSCSTKPRLITNSGLASIKGLKISLSIGHVPHYTSSMTDARIYYLIKINNL
jgi:hypothetical protein